MAALLMIAAGGALCAARASAQDSPEQTQGTPARAPDGQVHEHDHANDHDGRTHGLPGGAGVMQRALTAGGPGEAHRALEPLVGTWRTTARVTLGRPGSPPTVTAGRSVIRWMMDGRFLVEEHEGQRMLPHESGELRPGAYRSAAWIGYENLRQTYTMTQVDNTRTGVLVLSGSLLPSGRVFSFYGAVDDPLSGVRGRAVRYVLRVLGRDRVLVTVYDLHACESCKILEITYERIGS